MTTLTTEDVAKLAPSNRVVVDDSNMAEERRKHAHPFTDVSRLRAGDVIWTLPHVEGDHIIVVWTREGRAGFGRNHHLPMDEGPVTIDGKRIILTSEKGTKGRYDLVTGEPA